MRYLIGSGGHAKVLARIVDVVPTESDEDIFRLEANYVTLVNGVGGKRPEIWLKFHDNRGFRFEDVIDPSAVMRGKVLGSGVQVMALAVIQAGAEICNNVLINTRASVDHDSIIGSHVHVAPGATICGDVVIGEGTFIGPGATVCRGVKIGKGCTVGAGAVVLKDVADGETVYGVPATVRLPKRDMGVQILSAKEYESIAARI